MIGIGRTNSVAPRGFLFRIMRREVRFVFLVNNTGFHLNQKPEPSTPFLGPPDQPARPRTMPGAAVRRLPTRRMGPTRQNGFWGFGPLSRCRSLFKITLLHSSGTSPKISKSAISGCHPPSASPGHPIAYPESKPAPNPTLAPLELFKPFSKPK